MGLLAKLNPRLWLSRKGNPLLRDPTYAGYDALEQHMRAKHMNASAVRRAKQDRLHELLRGAA